MVEETNKQEWVHKNNKHAHSVYSEVHSTKQLPIMLLCRARKIFSINQNNVFKIAAESLKFI